jgi:hypothetical protein
VVVERGRREEMFPFFLAVFYCKLFNFIVNVYGRRRVFENMMKVFRKKPLLFKFKKQASIPAIFPSIWKYLIWVSLSIAAILLLWFWRSKKQGSLRHSYKCQQ